jgi:hypothetical protein
VANRSFSIDPSLRSASDSMNATSSPAPKPETAQAKPPEILDSFQPHISRGSLALHCKAH